MTTLTKRILRILVALCLVAVLCVGTLQVSATAQTTINYLAVGDSITAGYGLSSPSTEGFVTKFADAISGADTSVITVNAGVSGLTADDLVTALASGSYDTQLAAADVITLTIGGNDLMAAFYETVATLYTANENSGTTYTSQDVQTWLSAPTTYSTEVSTIISLISTDSGKATLTAAVGVAAQGCVGNIATIVGLIRAANTDAVILLANQYNPYTVLSSIPTYSTISTLFASATSSFNTLLAANTTISANCTIVDLYTAGVSTNVNLLTMNLDFHPNAAGHTTIANAMATAYAAATATPSTDYVIVGTAELHDGYYTTDGATIATTTPTDNYAYYSGGVLYLKNFTYAATSGDGISSTNDTLTIDLCDSSSTISVGDHGIYSTGALTITNGSLDVAGKLGIWTLGNTVISDCTSVNIVATDTGIGVGATINLNSLTISGSTVNVTVDSDSAYVGIGAVGDVNISGSNVTVTVNGEEVDGAIWSLSGNISITDESTVTAEVSATTYSWGAICTTLWTSSIGNITISDSEVTVSSVCTDTTNTTYNLGAIFTTGNISITDSTVTAEATGATICGGAITAVGDTSSIAISGSEITASSESTSTTGGAANSGAIYATCDISITDSKITAEATSTDMCGGAIMSYGSSSSITISGSEITASSVCTGTAYQTSNYGAIYASGDVSITGSEITASTNGGTAMDWYLVGACIMSGDGSITISASKVNATADSTSNFWTLYEYDIATAIFATEDIVISDESDITVSVTAVYGAEGIYAYKNLSITESTVNATAVGDLAYTIASNTTLLIEDCDSIIATVNGGTYTIGVGSTDVTITGSSVNAKASTTSSSPVVFAAIDVEETATITASEIIADGGIYLFSSTGSITVAPATGGLLKITETVGTTKVVSLIDAATVIDTTGYTYVSILEHEHTYDASGVAWTWTDYETVSATATCTDEDCTYQVTATASVTSDTDDATCTVDGKTVYKATATIDGTVYTDTQTEVLPATGHDYGFTEFTWAEDLLSAKAVYTCVNCGASYAIDATITMQGDNGVYTITATVTDSDGTVHSESQTAGASLSTIAADYTAVNDAIAKANSLVASNYTNFDTVTDAINKVQWNLSVVNQGTVNNYAEAIETAIANLIPVSSTTEETVNIDEPIEDTDTEVEPDEEEEPIETPVETNPTTGVALALLPMALALAGVVSRKRLG